MAQTIDIEASNLINEILGKCPHLNQTTLAQKIGLSSVHLCNIYNGKSRASIVLTNLLRLIKNRPYDLELLKEVVS